MLLPLVVPTVSLLRLMLLSWAVLLPLQAARTESWPLTTSTFPMQAVLALQPQVIRILLLRLYLTLAPVIVAMPAID